MTPFRERYEEIWAKHISPIQAAGTTPYAEHRHAQLQKARREIAENNECIIESQRRICEVHGVKGQGYRIRKSDICTCDGKYPTKP